MDDLAQKLSDLLSSPDGIQKLQAAAASLNTLKGNNSEAQSSAVPVSAGKPPKTDIGDFAGGDIETLSKLMPLISNFKKDDQDTMLLKSIRPYLKDDRRKRLDDAIKVMHMLKALPLLKDKGVL